MNPTAHVIAAAGLAGLLLLTPFATAQESPKSIVLDVVRQVGLDPTTYAPALIAFEGMSQDWKTSQVLFEHGWLESNPRFTISGRAHDIPVPLDIGRQQIREQALTVLQYSIVNNVAAAVSGRLLIARYPSHRKLVRTLSWVERIAFASIVAYRSSAGHFRQARNNRLLAQQYGYVAP